ncbi:hypothetical protein RP20_CCG012127 [Aedes albopictus]|nr:hypothetical protein RP20_CCG012127 [Aedes albopictus]
MDLEEDLLLLSQLEDVPPVATTSKSSETMKRLAVSPAANIDKKGRIDDAHDRKLTVRRPGEDVNSAFYEKLMSELVTRQVAIPMDQQQPIFLGSGVSQGVAWFTAKDQFSYDWLKTTLVTLSVNTTIPSFEVLLESAPVPLRRVIISIPLVPKLGKNPQETILRLISKLNKNLNTKYWRVFRMLQPANGKQSVILGVDEDSVVKIEAQKNKIFYAMSQVFVRIYEKQP